jgi:hypothetical protein
MPDRQLQGNSAAQRTAHHVGPLHPQLPHQGGDVIGHRLEAQWTLDIGGAAVSLQFDRDHLPRLCERGQDRTKHRDTDDSAVQQNERFAAAMDLVL